MVGREVAVAGLVPVALCRQAIYDPSLLLMGGGRPRGGVVTQRTANPCTGVRFPPRPPIFIQHRRPAASPSRAREGGPDRGPPAFAREPCLLRADPRQTRQLGRPARTRPGPAEGARPTRVEG